MLMYAGLDGPRVPDGWGSQISRQPAHVSPTHRPPLSSRKYFCTHFSQRMSRTQGHIAAGRIKSMKNSNDSIGNRTRVLQSASTSINCATGCTNDAADRLVQFSCIWNLHFNITLTSVSCVTPVVSSSHKMHQQNTIKTRTCHPSTAAWHSAPFRGHINRQMRRYCNS